MKIGPIVLRLRAAGIPPFGDRVSGAAELSQVQEDTLNGDTAYVVQDSELATPNDIEHDVSQDVTESFSVIVALRNDSSQADKTGLTAYDRLFDIRKRLFNTLVGWDIDDEDENDGYYPKTLVYFKRGDLLDVNSAWLWYQYVFEVKGVLQRTLEQADLDALNTISAQYVITPNAQIPIKGAKALPEAISLSDMEQIIDLTENLAAGSFGSGFSSGFDLYTGD